MPMPPPGGPAPETEGQGGNPEQVKALLIKAVQQMKRVCDEFGLDFEEIVSAGGNAPPGGGNAPPPAPGGMPPGMPPM